MTNNAEREAFEKRFRPSDDLTLDSDGYYLLPGTQALWDGFQAGFHVSAPDGGEVTTIHVNAVEDGGAILYVYPPIIKAGDKLYTCPKATSVQVERLEEFARYMEVSETYESCADKLAELIAEYKS